MMKQKRLRTVRFLFSFIWTILERLLTRTTVTGLENIPRDNQTPIIFAGNHASTYDPPLLMYHIPMMVRPVGPADFKLLFPANLVVENLGVIGIKRGKSDTESLKKMLGVLKGGENLALFADGGTWEKRIDDVKPGAAYLSLMSKAHIIPVAISGTYQVWSRIFQLKRPRITLHFAPPMPIVTNENRKERQQDLRHASLELMDIIHHHLTPAEQARYDLYARQQFSAQVSVLPDSLTPPDNDFSVLAELISKPNLFSPLHRNLKLPLAPFLQPEKYHAADDFVVAVTSLHTILENELDGFMDYRVGEHKTRKFMTECEQFEAFCQDAATQDLVVRFLPKITILDTPLPPNE